MLRSLSVSWITFQYVAGLPGMRPAGAPSRTFIIHMESKLAESPSAA